MAYSQNLLLQEPPAGDPAQTNNWATMVNTNMSLLDTAVAGLLPLAVTGGNLVLTSNSGAADQARNAHFAFTGVLASNELVLMPAGVDRMFSVSNGCTGAFTLTVGVNDGSGSAAAGTTVVVPQGMSVLLYSDGTNITCRQTGFVGNASVTGNWSVGGNLSVTGTVTVTIGGNQAFSIPNATTATFGAGGIASNFVSFSINGGSGAGSSHGYRVQVNGSVVAQLYYDVNSGQARLAVGGFDPCIGMNANTGTLRFFAYGAGTLTTDGSGNVTASSDATLKDIVGAFTRGTADLIKIDTCRWKWNEASKMDSGPIQASYTAQAVQTGVPEAVSVGPDGKLTVFDGAIIAALINSIKELNARIVTLEAKL